jgi:hypothetical protein
MAKLRCKINQLPPCLIVHLLLYEPLSYILSLIEHCQSAYLLSFTIKEGFIEFIVDSCLFNSCLGVDLKTSFALLQVIMNQQLV